MMLKTILCFMTLLKIAASLPNFVFRLDEPTFQQAEPVFPKSIKLDGIGDITLVTEALAVNISSANITIRDLMNVNYLNKITYPSANYIVARGLDDASMMSGCVAITEEYAITSSNGKDKFSGEVYVFAKTNDQYSWSPSAIVPAPDGVNSNFGYPLVTDNNRFITAATAVDGYVGRVYIFTRSGDSWFETAKINSPLGSFQAFGHSLDLQGDIAIIGTVNGIVFVYEVVEGEWILTTALQAPDLDPSFGYSVSLDGNYLVVGAASTADTTGAVYIYQRHFVGNWTLSQTMSSLSGPQSQFGYSVALSNDTLVIGAIGYRVDFYNPTGAIEQNTPGIVYVYKWKELIATTNNTTSSSTGRRLDGTLLPAGEFILYQIIDSPLNTAGYFGMSIGLIEGKMIIGADGYPKGLNSGAVFVYYNPTGEHWTLNVTFPSPAGFNGHFGFDVDISPSYVIIGAYGFNGLEGQVHIAPLPTASTTTPTSPTLPPAGSTNIDNKSSTTASVFPVGMVVAIALGALLFALLGSLLLFCCCCRPMALPVLLKKKKKEEEDSPYIVHSYVGYSEMDDHPVPQQPSGLGGYFFYPSYYGGASVNSGDAAMMKAKMMATGGSEKEKDIHSADEGFLRRMFPYKVYGPSGYQGDGSETNSTNISKKIEDDYDANEANDAYTEELKRNTNVNRQASRLMMNLTNPLPSSSVSVASSLTDANSSFSTTGSNGMNNDYANVDLSAIRQGLKAHHQNHASDYMQSMYYSNQQQRKQSDDNLVRLQPLDAERDQIRTRLMKKVSSGLSDIGRNVDGYDDDDSISCYSDGSSMCSSQPSQQQQVTTVKTVKTTTVIVPEDGTEQHMPATTNTTTTTSSSAAATNKSSSKVPSASQVESAKAKYAKYLAAVKKNPEFTRNTSSLSNTPSVTSSQASTTSSSSEAHHDDDMSVATGATGSSSCSSGSNGSQVECCDEETKKVITTTTVKRTVTTTEDVMEGGVTEAKASSKTTTTATAASNKHITTIAAGAASPEPTRHSSSHHNMIFHSPSVEIDVALTEPMKFVTLDEIDDEADRLRDGKSSALSYASSTVHTADPEAREDLVQREEIDRLRSIDQVRTKLVYSSQQQQQQQVEGGNSAMMMANDQERQKEEDTRVQEDAKLRAEEKARARFAMFKSKAEQLEKQSKH